VICAFCVAIAVDSTDARVHPAPAPPALWRLSPLEAVARLEGGEQVLFNGQMLLDGQPVTSVVDTPVCLIHARTALEALLGTPSSWWRR
jgi:hypothetical protein